MATSRLMWPPVKMSLTPLLIKASPPHVAGGRKGQVPVRRDAFLVFTVKGARAVLLPFFQLVNHRWSLIYIRGVKLIFTGGHISLEVAFKGPNVILGLYKCNYSLIVK